MSVFLTKLNFLRTGVVSLSFGTPNSRDVFDKCRLGISKRFGGEKAIISRGRVRHWSFQPIRHLVITAPNYRGKFSFFHIKELVTLNLTN